MPLKPDILDTTHAQVLVVDVQEKLLPHVVDSYVLIRRIVKLLRVAQALDLEITLTEQVPEKLGITDPRVTAVAGLAARYGKKTFSACADDTARGRLIARLRPQVIIAGVETHVCVQQTALDLLGMQMRPFVLADAVSARNWFDHEVALERMRAAGAVITTVESVIFELLKEVGTEQFRQVLPLIKGDAPPQATNGAQPPKKTAAHDPGGAT